MNGRGVVNNAGKMVLLKMLPAELERSHSTVSLKKFGKIRGITKMQGKCNLPDTFFSV